VVCRKRERERRRERVRERETAHGAPQAILCDAVLCWLVRAVSI
jgi:hypothetical protein